LSSVQTQRWLVRDHSINRLDSFDFRAAFMNYEPLDRKNTFNAFTDEVAEVQGRRKGKDGWKAKAGLEKS
jgi:hypothetical protein